jgi:cell wall-associated NlpC family hydrolase
MAVDVVELSKRLRLIDHKGKRSLELFHALSDPPTLTLSMDTASTLTVPLADAERVLLRSPVVAERSWAEVDQVRFELAGVSKSADRTTLTFEDGIAAALRRITSPLSVGAGRTTRREFAIRLAKEARVPYQVDPQKRTNVSHPLERSAHGSGKTNSWDVLGDMAEEIHWRRFSDGKHLVVGGDEWLFDRDENPSRLREHTGPVGDIDFDLAVGKRVSEATVAVDAEAWALPPGAVVLLGDDMGPAEGKWLVGEFSRPLTSTLGTVKLVRGRHTLKEPKRPVGGHGEPGDPGYVPGQDGTADGGAAGTAARERMVRFALSKVGGPYVWGGHGPVGYDCSGLVQDATAAAGKTLPAPSANQWARCVGAERTIPIATALNTRGALLFRIGVGDYNHVAISLGNGSTVEARGTAYGIGVFGGAAGGGWTGAALWV